MSLATKLLQKVHEAKQAEDEMSVPKYDDLKTPNNHVGSTSNATKESPVSGLGDRKEKKPTADIGTPHNEKGRKMSEQVDPIQALGIHTDGGMLHFHHPNNPEQMYSIEYDRQMHQFLQNALRRTQDVGEVFMLLQDYNEKGGGQDPRNRQGLAASKGAWPMAEATNPIVQALNMHNEKGMLRLTSPDGSTGMLVPMSGPVQKAINGFITSPDARADTQAAAERLFTMLGQKVPGVQAAEPEAVSGPSTKSGVLGKGVSRDAGSGMSLEPMTASIGEGKQHKTADGEMKKPAIKNTAPAASAKVRGKQNDEPTNKGNPGTGKEEKGQPKQQFSITPKDYKGGENEHKSMKKMHENIKGLEELLGRKLHLQGAKTD
jgi:hypothetical protein